MATGAGLFYVNFFWQFNYRYGTMNGKERILTSLALKEPDCVPLYIHGINEGPIIGIGKHLTEGLPEPRDFRLMNERDQLKLVDTLFLIHEHYDIDGITTFEIGHEEKVDALHVRDGFGVVYKLSEYGIPVPVGHPVKDMGELMKFTPPDPKKEDLGLLQLAVGRFQGKKATFWLMRGIFVRSWRLIGMTNYMMNLYSDPEFIHALAKVMLDFSLAQLELLAEAGLDVLVIEDDIAMDTGPMVSLEHFKEFINQYNRQIVERARQKGLKVVRHSDGNLWPLLDLLIETGYDGLNPLEPQADMDIKKVKDYCGDKICLLGNIDCVDLLPRGTAKEVEQAVIQAIEDGAAGGGLIICSSNSLHQGVNPENCIAMFEAVRKHGQYSASAHHA
jgi:uroporphyrinogen decarboxylase